MSRKVTVFSMQDNSRITADTNAETWGQLKSENSQINKMQRDMKVTIKENRTTIESDDSLLPDGDCTLFLFAAKVKAGATPEEKLIEEYSTVKAKEIIEAFEKDIEAFDKKVRKTESK